jgi:hypothetical protein
MTARKRTKVNHFVPNNPALQPQKP